MASGKHARSIPPMRHAKNWSFCSATSICESLERSAAVQQPEIALAARTDLGFYRVSNTERTGEITGKISANPNPIFFGQGCVVISWETNDPAGAEVRVSTSPDDEKLVSKSREQSGHDGNPVDCGFDGIMSFAFTVPVSPRPVLIPCRSGATSIPRRWLCENLQTK